MIDQEIKHLEELVEKINNEHKHKLNNVSEPILLTVVLSNDSKVDVEINKHGVKILKHLKHKEFEIKNHITISYKQLKKSLENKANIIRYLMSGKVKVKGNLKYILDVLSEL
jgi:putative sterol carrier protein